MASNSKFDIDGFDVDVSNKCTADGGFYGTSYGRTRTVTDGDVTLDGDEKVVDIQAATVATIVTLSDGADGQELFVVAGNATAGAGVVGSFVGGGTTLTLTVNEYCHLVWVSTQDRWLIVATTGTEV